MAIKEETTISISKEEYDILIEDQNLLKILFFAGVDNWEGFGEAMKNYNAVYTRNQ